MAIIRKYNPDMIYISSRLKNSLDTILNHNFNIISTPFGYGKSTAVKEYLNMSNVDYIWFNIYNSDRKQFFEDFCAKINSIDEASAATMKKIGYPIDENGSNKLASAIINIDLNKKTVLVLDNYNYISDKYMDKVMKDLSGKKDGNLIIVQLIQSNTSDDEFDMVISKNINYISKDIFELNQNEIMEYYKLCGIKLEEKEAENLLAYTEGWFSALYLQMRTFAATGEFEHTMTMNNLVAKEIWSKLSIKEQELFIALSIFDEFTIKQAVFISNGQFKDEDVINLIKKCGFIKYDRKERRYYFHTILKHFLTGEFTKLEKVMKKGIYKMAGRWYADNDDNFMAIIYYIKNGEYESILSLDWTRQRIWEHATRKNKEIFMDVVAKTPDNIKKKYPKNYLVFVLSLFLLNERNYFKSECELAEEYIENTESMGKLEKKQLLGECYFLQALNHFGDIKKMNEYYIKALDLIGSPTKLFRGYNLLGFDSPSVFCMFHNCIGQAEDEVEILSNSISNYYMLTEGNCKGLDNLMKAELLYNTGNLKDAALLCEKAEYMGDSRNQAYIKIITLLLKGRIALMNGDYQVISKCISEMENIQKEDLEVKNDNLFDICKSFLDISYENIETLPHWLQDNSQIEMNTSIMTLGFTNIIYGRFLLIKEDYNRLLAIGGQMLNLAGIFSNVMYKIYTYLYIAIAKYHTKEYEKSVEILYDAINEACDDNIIMPFCELSNELLVIFEKIEYRALDKKSKVFVETLKKSINKYNKRINEVKKTSQNAQSLGLTKRELEVAKLAAKRMSNKEIADMLFIAESTVKSNLKIIFSKLSINSRGELKDYFND